MYRQRQMNRGTVVYFVRRSSDGAVKIGFTANLRRRINNLRSSGDILTIEAIMPGGRNEESSEHFRLRSERVDGEWFVGPAVERRIQEVVTRHGGLKVPWPDRPKMRRNTLS